VGYSSLAYLKQLPVQMIEIDRSFMHSIGTDPEDEAVVRANVTLGHTLGKVVVAEAVETEPQLAFLRRLGCDAAQGLMLARLLDAAGVASAARPPVREHGGCDHGPLDAPQ
jgi:EAL domain-containing protein (putative c-di-GMP-specific phosphodiesterase class I)